MFVFRCFVICVKIVCRYRQLRLNYVKYCFLCTWWISRIWLYHMFFLENSNNYRPIYWSGSWSPTGVGTWWSRACVVSKYRNELLWGASEFAISSGDRKERMQSWMSSGKSEKENEESVGSLGLAIFFSSRTTLFCREILWLCFGKVRWEFGN